MPKWWAKLTGATQLRFAAGVCLVTTVSFSFPRTSTNYRGSRNSSLWVDAMGVEGGLRWWDHNLRWRLLGNPTVGLCCECTFWKDTLPLSGEMMGLEKGGEAPWHLDSEDQCCGSFPHGRSPPPPSTQERLSSAGCVQLTAGAGSTVVHDFIIFPTCSCSVCFFILICGSTRNCFAALLHLIRTEACSEQ